MNSSQHFEFEGTSEANLNLADGAIESSADIAGFLVSDHAFAIVRAAIDNLGWVLIDYRADTPFIRPGAGVSVGYFVTARATDRKFETYLIASTEDVSADRAVLAFTDPEGIIKVPIYVWQFPNDPELPALADAADVAIMRNVWPEKSELAAKIVVYRPTRRAVLEYSSRGETFGFAKIVHPRQGPELIRRTRAVAQGESPVPPIIYATDDGMVVSAQAKGQPLSNIIAFDHARAIGLLDVLADALNKLPKPVVDLDRHLSWTDRVASYAHTATEILPQYADDIARVHAWIKSVVVDTAEPVVATHGDFFEANIFVDDDDRLTLIDLDHVGPGYRNDDWACLLAHVSVLPFLTEDQWVNAEDNEPFREDLEALCPGGMRCPYYPNAEAVLRAWLWRFEKGSASVRDLYARACAVTLSLVANSDPMQSPREAEARMRRALWWMDKGIACEKTPAQPRDG